jgi:hypothetical protein
MFNQQVGSLVEIMQEIKRKLGCGGPELMFRHCFYSLEIELHFIFIISLLS